MSDFNIKKFLSESFVTENMGAYDPKLIAQDMIDGGIAAISDANFDDLYAQYMGGQGDPSTMYDDDLREAVRAAYKAILKKKVIDRQYKIDRKIDKLHEDMEFGGHEDQYHEDDGFIQDNTRGGYDASVEGKFIGNYDDVDVAFQAIRDHAGPNFFPDVWFVDDHGGIERFDPYQKRDSNPYGTEGNGYDDYRLDHDPDEQMEQGDMFTNALSQLKEYAGIKETAPQGAAPGAQLKGKDKLKGKGVKGYNDAHPASGQLVGEADINEVIDYGYWDWSTEQFIELARAGRKYMAGKGVNLETGDGYEEFFQKAIEQGYEEDALDILDALGGGDSIYDAASSLKANANYQKQADGITNMIDMIGFEPKVASYNDEELSHSDGMYAEGDDVGNWHDHDRNDNYDDEPANDLERFDRNQQRGAEIDDFMSSKYDTERGLEEDPWGLGDHRKDYEHDSGSEDPRTQDIRNQTRGSEWETSGPDKYDPEHGLEDPFGLEEELLSELVNFNDNKDYDSHGAAWAAKNGLDEDGAEEEEWRMAMGHDQDDPDEMIGGIEPYFDDDGEEWDSKDAYDDYHNVHEDEDDDFIGKGDADMGDDTVVGPGDLVQVDAALGGEATVVAQRAGYIVVNLPKGGMKLLRDDEWWIEGGDEFSTDEYVDVDGDYDEPEELQFEDDNHPQMDGYRGPFKRGDGSVYYINVETGNYYIPDDEEEVDFTNFKIREDQAQVMGQHSQDDRQDPLFREGYTILPPMDDRYVERDGLEGPFRLRSGKVYYYDPKAGKNYDPDTDMYMSDEDWFAHDADPNQIKPKYKAPAPAAPKPRERGRMDEGPGMMKKMGKSIKRNMQGWDGMTGHDDPADSSEPFNILKRVRSYSTEELYKYLEDLKGGKPHSFGDLFTKATKRELRRRGERDFEKYMDEAGRMDEGPGMMKKMGKKIKRAATWGGEYSRPDDMVKRHQEYSTDTLKGLDTGPTPKWATGVRKFQDKLIKRNLRKRGERDFEKYMTDSEQLELDVDNVENTGAYKMGYKLGASGGKVSYHDNEAMGPDMPIFSKGYHAGKATLGEDLNEIGRYQDHEHTHDEDKAVFKRKEMDHELRNERGINNYMIFIGGKKWKAVKNERHAAAIVSSLKKKGKDAEYKYGAYPIQESDSDKVPLTKGTRAWMKKTSKELMPDAVKLAKDDGGYHAVTTSDKAKIAQLKKDGYKVVSNEGKIPSNYAQMMARKKKREASKMPEEPATIQGKIARDEEEWEHIKKVAKGKKTTEGAGTHKKGPKVKGGGYAKPNKPAQKKAASKAGRQQDKKAVNEIEGTALTYKTDEGQIAPKKLNNIISRAMDMFGIDEDELDNIRDLVLDDFLEGDIGQVTVQDVVEILEASGWGDGDRGEGDDYYENDFAETETMFDSALQEIETATDQLDQERGLGEPTQTEPAMGVDSDAELAGMQQLIKNTMQEPDRDMEDAIQQMAMGDEDPNAALATDEIQQLRNLLGMFKQ